jgi:hypothetical protein
MAREKHEQVTLTVLSDDKPDECFTLAKTTDWSVFAEDILEIKSADGVTTYIPIDALTRWVIRAA